MKSCSSCLKTEEQTEFYKRPDGSYRQPCKVCYPERQYQWRLNNLEKRRAYDKTRRPIGSPHRWTEPEDPILKRDHYYKRTYGISLEEYETLLRSQNGLCKICRKSEIRKSATGLVHRLSLDHNHKCCPGTKSCGKCIRGLLCHKCNVAIGHLNDDPDLLARAIDYLRSNEHG